MIKELNSDQIIKRIQTIENKISYNSFRGLKIRIQIFKDIIHNILINYKNQFINKKSNRLKEEVEKIYDDSYGEQGLEGFFNTFEKSNRFNYYSINNNFFIKI